MKNTQISQADSNMIATMDWEISLASFKSMVESNHRRGQMELKGYLRCKEFIWHLYLVNDGHGLIQLTLDCTTTTEYCFPTLYYDLRFAGTVKRPYERRKGPLYSLIKGPRQFYSYGTINLLSVPMAAFHHDFQHFMPNDRLMIGLRLYTFYEVNGATEIPEYKMTWKPKNGALMNDLKELLEEPIHSDVTISCSGGALKAHKCILAARSTFFSEIFNSIADEVPIADVDVSVMRLVLQFIYTGETILSETNFTEILRCAEKFDLRDLRTECLNQMCHAIKVRGGGGGVWENIGGSV